MTNRKKISLCFLRHTIVIFAITLWIVASGMTAFAETDNKNAKNIASDCTFYAEKIKGEYHYLYNKNCVDALTVYNSGETGLFVDLNEQSASSLYIKWGKYAPNWILETTLSDGTAVRAEYGTYGFIQEYVELPEDAVSFRMIANCDDDLPMHIVELEIYTHGTLPDSVHRWSPSPTSAEIMYVSTHQDDEILFFGGAIPYYSGELKYDSVVVYTAYENYRRLHEALEGLWLCGERQHPVFLNYPDYYCKTLETAEKIWGLDNIVRSLTEQIVKFRPQVIITQDEHGEYGHGQHKLTVFAVEQALNAAEDSSYLSENIPGAKPWSVKKCYLHLYPENSITMPWNEIITEGGEGKNAFETAQEAYLCHLSQITNTTFSLSFERNDCRRFGLYRTTVGADILKNDFFENITLRYKHVQPPAEEVFSFMEPIDAKGWLYVRTDNCSENEKYLRYCDIDGEIGWYAADYSGCPLEPARKVILAEDCFLESCLPYDGLTLISKEPQLFCFTNQSTGQEMILRYCSTGQSEAQFYLSDEQGSLATPLTPIDVPLADTEEAYSSVNEYGVRAANIGFIVFLCVIIAALVFCITSIGLLKRKR